MKSKIFILIMIILFTTACSSNYLKNINLDKLNKKLDNKETFVLYLTNEDNYGTTLRNTLLKVAKKNDIKTFYLNTEKITDENKLNKLKEKFYFEESNFIVFVKDGVEKTVLSRIDDAYISTNKLEEELKNQGYLN